MLIPQYSIRWLLKLMAGSALVFPVFGLAVRGSGWAQAVSAGLVVVCLLFLVYALLFTFLWIFGVLTAPLRRRMVGYGKSPFLYESPAPPSASREPPAEPEVPAVPTILE